MPTTKGDDRPPAIMAFIAQEAMEVTCEACNITMFEMTMKRRSRAHIAFSRQIAMYLCHVVGQMTLGEISSAFERDRTTVCYACHTIEDRRDSPIFDRQVEVLEGDLRERLKTIFTRYRLPGAPTEVDTRVARMCLARA